MSDVAATPAVSEATPAAAPIVTPAPVVTPPPVSKEEEPWFKPRIEQAKRSGVNEAMAALGVKSVEEAKALLEKGKAAEEAQKSELQKANERIAALSAGSTRLTALEETVKKRADYEMSGLTEAQKAAVVAVAGDDTARILTTIDAFKPTWQAASDAQKAAHTAETARQESEKKAAADKLAAEEAAKAAPTNTAPAPNAPTSKTESPVDRHAEYQSLRKKNPVAAAAYLNAYNKEIVYPGQQ